MPTDKQESISMSNQLAKRIPYATADYRRLRHDNSYYVDKTRFIPLLEAAPYYLFCIRPRRFGKSLWLSVLQHYQNEPDLQIKPNPLIYYKKSDFYFFMVWFDWPVGL